MANNWWWTILLFVGLCNGPSFALAASGDAGDIMFVLDGSGSIEADDFDRAKNFISQVVDAFDIAADFTRVGLIQFGSQFREEFPLNAYSDKASLQQAIRNIPLRGGGTLIGQVIHYLIGTSFTEAKGARPLSEGIPRIAVFITDGAANDDPDTVLPPAISALEASTIIPFSIGVGSAVKADQLLDVALGDSDRVFQVGTYSVIDSIRQLLVERVRVILESPSSPRPELPLTSRPPTSTQRRTTQQLMTPRATTQKVMTSTATTQEPMTPAATTQRPMTSSSATQPMAPITMTQLINTSTATIKTKTATPTNTLYYIAGAVGSALLLIIIVVIIIVVIKCRKRQDDEPEAPQEDPFKREELGPREFVFNNPAFGSADHVPTNRWQEAAGYSDPAPEEPVYVNTSFSGGKNTQENEYVYRG